MFLAEVCFETNDVIRLADFYRRLLGIEEENMDEVHQTITGDRVAITVYHDGSPKNNLNRNISLAFTVEDVDAEYVRMLAMGITIIEPPTTRPWGARNMHFCDPDGNHIYLRSFPK
ncbi:MAG: lactoylglutathione lyase family protein [Herbinix sp.]|jgi:predicted enzyme related to lactoylglutathione lyase|nr:lactoylglutathione lyase family protein [Herbinix sp.]